MPLNTAQLIALRKIAKRKNQPRRKLRGGNKVKNPNPQPYLKTKVVKLDTTPAVGWKEIEKIKAIMDRYEIPYKQAKAIWLSRQKP